jgi:sortase (surface protein transpeptidase)
MGRVARVALLAALASALVIVPAGSQATPPRAGNARAGSPASAPPAVSAFRSVRTYNEVALPVRLRIPAIGIDTPVEQIGRQPDGTIEVPKRFDVAGWYNEAARPGQAGPAVVLGHVDSSAGPAVFFRLSALPVGAMVYVDRADATSASFRVTGQTRVPKTAFPTDLVYSPTLQPSLRLVTCGGSFDHHVRSYQDNVIVYAVPA